MKRSKLLTIPRAVTRMLLATLLLTMTAQMAGATDKTLSGSESYTAQDGDVLTGSTSGTVTDCRNLHFHRPCCSPFSRNPAPLMHNYIIK